MVREFLAGVVESWARVLLPLQTCHTERSMAIKYVETIFVVQRRPAQLSSSSLNRMTRSVTKSPRVAQYSLIVEVEKGRVAIYRYRGSFTELKSHCHLYGAQGQRQAYMPR
ncbi:hypothetical protein TNCV_3603241 [Trichonephila clavipes]|nr:hypothetical protein TNCV_3603241 [Trichonephila clavipes]